MVAVSGARPLGRAARLPGGRSGALSEAPPAVEATGLGWSYRGRDAPSLRDVSFRLDPGHVLLVLGPSGSGKSTLARALVGLVPHTLPGTWQGSLRVGPFDVPTTPARVLGTVGGLVFQDPESQIAMPRVDDEVAFGLENRGWAPTRMRQRVPEALELVGLAGFEERSTVRLSGGEQQRLAIAGVMAPLPGLLVLDEPTANLDPPGVAAVFRRLGAIAAGRRHTVVVIEHRVDAALPLADRVLVLDGRGAPLAFGTPDDVGRAADEIRATGAWLPHAWDGVPAVPPARDRGADAGSPVLVARDVSFAYPAEHGGRREAVRSVTLEIRRGERVALVGPNGSGKSTLLFLLAGLRRPDAGEVRIGARGGPPVVDPSRLRGAEVPRTLGFAFQDPELAFVSTTVAEEVTAGRGPAPDGDADVVLDRFGLGHLGSESPYTLSQGEQRRLSVAAAAAARPDVLLLDEPTFALDRRGSDRVVGLLDDLRADGTAQVLATHDPRLLPACDRVVALDAGRVVFDGPPAAFLARPPYDPAEPWQLPAPA